jgi:hypothetical protein
MRNRIWPMAAFKHAMTDGSRDAVGQEFRRTMQRIADAGQWSARATIENPVILGEIGAHWRTRAFEDEHPIEPFDRMPRHASPDFVQRNPTPTASARQDARHCGGPRISACRSKRNVGLIGKPQSAA